MSTHSYRGQLRDWLDRCNVSDEHDRPVHLTPHQWRHTFGTRLINRDVPQKVVRVLLDHSSGELTAHYANARELHQMGEFRQVAYRGRRLSARDAALLARLLGIHVSVAAAWQRASGGDWTHYAADLSRRT